MKRILTFLVFLFFSTCISAQDKSDYTWIFGGDITDTLDNVEGSIIDFNNGKRTTIYQEMLIPMGFTNASISDKETGQILFYTNGCSIMDSTHNIMMNGDDLNPGEIHNEWCDEGYDFPQVNTTIILDDPSDQSIYHVIHQNRVPQGASGFGLLYSKIDMNLNNGLGQVTQKNEIIVDYVTLHGSYVTAARKPNNEGWWLMVMERLQNDLYLFEVNEDGVNIYDTLKQDIPFSETISSSGHACFSPDGNTYAWYNPHDHLHVYDFDRNIGSISNYRQVDIPEYPDGMEFTGSISISPSNQYAYLSSDFQLYQVDLWSTSLQNLLESVTLIAEWDGFGDPLPTGFNSIMHAPDCKMYVVSGAGVKHLGVIHYPDNKGLACDFRQHDFELPWHKWSGRAPNFPHFRINEPSPCNDQITNTHFVPNLPNLKIKVTPNPVDDQLYFSFTEMMMDKNTLFIYDSMGQLVKEVSVKKYLHSKNVNVSDLNQGIYYYQLSSASVILGTGSFIKI